MESALSLTNKQLFRQQRKPLHRRTATPTLQHTALLEEQAETSRQVILTWPVVSLLLLPKIPTILPEAEMHEILPISANKMLQKQPQLFCRRFRPRLSYFSLLLSSTPNVPV